MPRARRAALDEAGLGAKTKCQRSIASPETRRPRTRALAASPGMNLPASRYTGSIVTLAPIAGAPGSVITVGSAPAAVAVDPAAGSAYVTNLGDNTVSAVGDDGGKVAED